MKLNMKNPMNDQTGFSLVEIMVGLVIGLLASLVIMQVFSVFEGQKRSTTGSADAQTNGSVALYTVQRDIQMAGYGLIPSGLPGVRDSPIECTTVTIDPATSIGSISPITITDGGTGSDSVTIRYSNSDSAGIPSIITGPGAVGDAVVGNVVLLGNNMSCQNGDIALLNNLSACNLTSVTGLSLAADPPPASITLNDSNGAVVGRNIACLGTWQEITYRASGGNLERCDRTTAIANGGNCNLVTPNVDFGISVPDIVNIQAQYGIGVTTATNPNRITQWLNATGTLTPAALALPTVAAVDTRNRIKAIRIAIVARNGLLEKEAVTNPCSSLTADAPTGLCSWSATSAQPQTASPAPAINLAADPDWRRYRYRVFETIIPLRNVIWARSTL